MGAKSRTKGKQGEREICALARSYGLSSERTWQNASSNDPLVRNVDVVIAGRKCQSKRVKALPRFLRELLPKGCDMGFIREDDGEWLVVLPAWRVLAGMQVSGYGKKVRMPGASDELPTT